MFEEFPRIQDAKKWAKANKRKLQSIVEVDYYDSTKNAWRATRWIEGLPAQSLLIHEKQCNKANLAGKNVTFSNVFKSVQHDDYQEIWISCLKIIC